MLRWQVRDYQSNEKIASVLRGDLVRQATVQRIGFVKKLRTTVGRGQNTSQLVANNCCAYTEYCDHLGFGLSHAAIITPSLFNAEVYNRQPPIKGRLRTG